MTKLYNFQVETTIRGFIQRELEDDEDPEEYVKQLEGETVNYQDIEDCFPSEIEVSTEINDFGEAETRVI